MTVKQKLATLAPGATEDDTNRAEFVMLCARIGIANGLRTKRGAHLFGPRAEVRAHLKHGFIEILAEDATYVIRFA